MQQYDALVIGSGCGLSVAQQAGQQGMKVALIEAGALGGTCLNVGCIPSKMLIAAADALMETLHARRLGVRTSIESVDFPAIMRRMRAGRAESQRHLRAGVKSIPGVSYLKGTGKYVEPGVVQVRDERITAPLAFIAAGARPLLPPIPGLESIDYLTNETLLELNDLPESLIIIGGGYIAVEFCHFFAAMGTRVTVIEMADRLMTLEEPEISAALQHELSKRARIVTGARVESVSRFGAGVRVVARAATGEKTMIFRAAHLLVAAGRRSNADIIGAAAGGLKTDRRGFIEVDSHLLTNRPGTYAIGDINGKAMFRHAANVQAAVAVANGLFGQNVEMDYHVLPHAVFSWPQVASVGLTEAQAVEAGYKVNSQLTPYNSVAKGKAIAETVGFTKAVVEEGTEHIVGFHVIGPYAPILIQEVVNAMQSGGHVDEIARSVHIHPELTELIPSSFETIVQ